MPKILPQISVFQSLVISFIQLSVLVPPPHVTIIIQFSSAVSYQFNNQYLVFHQFFSSECPMTSCNFHSATVFRVMYLYQFAALPPSLDQISYLHQSFPILQSVIRFGIEIRDMDNGGAGNGRQTSMYSGYYNYYVR